MVFTSRRMIIDKLAPIDGHVNCARKHIRRGSHRSMNYNQFCNVHHQYDSAKSAVSRTDVPFSPRGTAYSRKNISCLHRMYEDQSESNAPNVLLTISNEQCSKRYPHMGNLGASLGTAGRCQSDHENNNIEQNCRYTSYYNYCRVTIRSYQTMIISKRTMELPYIRER